MGVNDQIPLFNGSDINGFIGARQAGAIEKLNSIPEENLVNSDSERLVDSIFNEFRIKPIDLDEENITMSTEETRVDISNDPNYFIPSFIEGPHLVPGTSTNFDIPFFGDEEIFKYHTNPCLRYSPIAELIPGYIRIRVIKPHSTGMDAIRDEYEKRFKAIKRAIGFANGHVNSHNSGLKGILNMELSGRINRLGEHRILAESLGIRLVKSEDAPPIDPVKIDLTPSPQTTESDDASYPNKYGVSSEDFELILRVIRHQGRTFERTPSTYSIHGEEDLRDFILAQLNGYFVGDATGETFRKSGKTDICIQKDDCAAFVGECKIWSGPNGISKALSQLLGYLTWRDSKAALIIFNKKSKNITKILNDIPNAMRKHPQFTRDFQCDEDGEWRIEVCGNQDEKRKIIVHVFLFDLQYDNI